MVGFIFGGNTGETAESLARKRAMIERLMAGDGTPKTAQEGWARVMSTLGGAIGGYRLDQQQKAGADEARKTFADIAGGLFGQTPASSAASSSSIPTPGMGAQAAATAPATSTSGALPSSLLSAIDSTEGAGGYDTLYGHAQRNGALAGTDVSKMTLGQAMAFADPSGPYAQQVKSQIGRVATPMGRYQIVGTTLRNAVEKMGLDPNTPFDAGTQDAIATYLAKQRISGAGSLDGKISALRSEWAGLRNVPRDRMAQIIADLENGGSMASASPTTAATPTAPQQVASLDQSIGMPAAAAQVAATAPGYRDPAVVAPNAQPQPDTQQIASLPPLDPPRTIASLNVAAQPAQQGNPNSPFIPKDMRAQPQTQVAQAQTNRAPSVDPRLFQILSSPFTPPDIKAQAQMLLQQQMQAQTDERQLQKWKAQQDYEREQQNKDPLRQAQIAKAQRELQHDGETFFGNPVAVQNADGSLSYGQIGNRGTFRPIQLGQGQTFAPPTKQIDGGTETLQVDQAGNVIARIPKNVSQTEAEKAAGKAEGEAKAALPAIEGSANEMISSIDALLNDPYLDNMIGSIQGGWLPNVTSDARRVQGRMDQIGGQSFLQAFNMLRGAGQITEQEGAKATAAMSRLNTAQSEKDYRDALMELRGVVERSISRAREKAGGPPGQSPPAASNSAPTPSAPASPAAPQGARPRAVNKQTGQILEFDGKDWVPVL